MLIFSISQIAHDIYHQLQLKFLRYLFFLQKFFICRLSNKPNMLEKLNIADLHQWYNAVHIFTRYNYTEEINKGKRIFVSG